MNYYVVGADGKEYGPVPIDTLRDWVKEGRVTPATQVKSFETGAVSNASTLPGLFDAPMATAPPPPNMANNPYGQPSQPYGQPTGVNQNYRAAAQQQVEESMGPFWNVVIRCVAAIALFFFLHGIGLIFAGYALFYAIQAKSDGNKYGVVSLIIAGITVAIIGVGWMLRLNGAGI